MFIAYIVGHLLAMFVISTDLMSTLRRYSSLVKLLMIFINHSATLRMYLSLGFPSDTTFLSRPGEASFGFVWHDASIVKARSAASSGCFLYRCFGVNASMASVILRLETVHGYHNQCDKWSKG
jgi:hypothetical protein